MKNLRRYTWAMISLVGLPLFGYHESLAAKRPALTASPRFEENYSFLRSPHTDQDFFDPIKYVSFGPDPMPYLSFGGEVRERYEAFIKNPLFGIRPSLRLGAGIRVLHFFICSYMCLTTYNVL
jgi:hypothetical protein